MQGCGGGRGTQVQGGGWSVCEDERGAIVVHVSLIVDPGVARKVCIWSGV